MSIFKDKEEDRLRAGWRLLLGIVIYGCLIFATAIAAGIIGFAFQNIIIIPEAYRKISELVLGQFISVIAIVISVFIAARFIDKRKVRDYGLNLNKEWFEEFILGFFLGVFMISAVFAVEYTSGLAQIKDTFTMMGQNGYFWLEILMPFFIFVLVSIHEEILARGYLLLNFAEGFNNCWVASVLSSLIFSLLHLGNPNTTVFGLVNIFLFGIIMATAFIYTGKLAIPIGIHLSWNFFVGNVFGYPVSGISDLNISILSVQQKPGYEFWTGGAFGPEGGILATLSIIMGLVIILFWIKMKYNKYDSRLKKYQK